MKHLETEINYIINQISQMIEYIDHMYVEILTSSKYINLQNPAIKVDFQKVYRMIKDSTSVLLNGVISTQK